MKVVRFHPTLETIGYTYSSTDYDRSHFSIPDFNTSRKILLFNNDALSSSSSSMVEIKNNRPTITPLDFSKISKASSSPTNNFDTKKPKLKINTKMTNDPLFFTHLSTHYQSCFQDVDDIDDDYDHDHDHKNFNIYENNNCLSTY